VPISHEFGPVSTTVFDPTKPKSPFTVYTLEDGVLSIKPPLPLLTKFTKLPESASGLWYMQETTDLVDAGLGSSTVPNQALREVLIEVGDGVWIYITLNTNVVGSYFGQELISYTAALAGAQARLAADEITYAGTPSYRFVIADDQEEITDYQNMVSAVAGLSNDVPDVVAGVGVVPYIPTVATDSSVSWSLPNGPWLYPLWVDWFYLKVDPTTRTVTQLSSGSQEFVDSTGQLVTIMSSSPGLGAVGNGYSLDISAVDGSIIVYATSYPVPLPRQYAGCPGTISVVSSVASSDGSTTTLLCASLDPTHTQNVQGPGGPVEAGMVPYLPGQTVDWVVTEVTPSTITLASASHSFRPGVGGATVMQFVSADALTSLMCPSYVNESVDGLSGYPSPGLNLYYFTVDWEAFDSSMTSSQLYIYNTNNPFVYGPVEYTAAQQLWVAETEAVQAAIVPPSPALDPGPEIPLPLAPVTTEVISTTNPPLYEWIDFQAPWCVNFASEGFAGDFIGNPTEAQIDISYYSDAVLGEAYAGTPAYYHYYPWGYPEGTSGAGTYQEPGAMYAAYEITPNNLSDSSPGALSWTVTDITQSLPPDQIARGVIGGSPYASATHFALDDGSSFWFNSNGDYAAYSTVGGAPPTIQNFFSDPLSPMVAYCNPAQVLTNQVNAIADPVAGDIDVPLLAYGILSASKFAMGSSTFHQLISLLNDTWDTDAVYGAPGSGVGFFLTEPLAEGGLVPLVTTDPSGFPGWFRPWIGALSFTCTTGDISDGIGGFLAFTDPNADTSLGASIVPFTCTYSTEQAVMTFQDFPESMTDPGIVPLIGSRTYRPLVSPAPGWMVVSNFLYFFSVDQSIIPKTSEVASYLNVWKCHFFPSFNWELVDSYPYDGFTDLLKYKPGADYGYLLDGAIISTGTEPPFAPVSSSSGSFMGYANAGTDYLDTSNQRLAGPPSFWAGAAFPSVPLKGGVNKLRHVQRDDNRAGSRANSSSSRQSSGRVAKASNTYW
jgi:hypothetical protein